MWSLEILRILSVKGGVGAIIEWGGEGVKTLSVPERATITNMGTELGATTSIFLSDEVTKAFLEAEGRGEDYVELASDPDAVYDKVIDIDLSALEPLIACPHSPGQCGQGLKPQRHQGRPGLHRLMYQLVPLRYAQSSSSAQGQDHPSGGEPFHLTGLQAGTFHAGRLRRSFGHTGQRRKTP